MRSFARFSAYAAVAAVLLAGGLFSLIGSRFGKKSDLSKLLFQSRRSEALQYRCEMVNHNIETKQAIVAELVAGRLTLHEAAIRFQEANLLVENDDPDLLPNYVIPTTEEGVYRHALGWTRTEVRHLPAEQAKRILAPLEKEYESKFGPLESATVSLKPAARTSKARAR
jgi:hypothetical protein